MFPMNENNIEALLKERERLSRRLTLFEGYGIPSVILSGLYERLEEMDLIIRSQALVASWAGQTTGEA